MILPYTVDVPMQRLPIANWLLIAATFVFTIQSWVRESPVLREFEQPISTDLEVLAKKYEQRKKLREQPPPPAWSLVRGQAQVSQYFTYGFAHASISQLVGNMIFLFCFGNAVNAKLGHVLFLFLYFLLGAFAGFCWLFLGHGDVLVGATGAVMGICGVFLVFFPKNDVRVFFYGFHGFNWFETPSMWLVLLAMVLDLLGTLVFAHDGVAYVSHLGGELLGILLGIVLLLTGLAKSEEYELNLLQVLGLQAPPGDGDWRKKSKRKQPRKG